MSRIDRVLTWLALTLPDPWCNIFGRWAGKRLEKRDPKFFARWKRVIGNVTDRRG